MSTEAIGTVWDAAVVRRAIRVLGAQPSPATDPVAVARALRLVRDMLDRRGVKTEVFQVPGSMPLLIAGDGPALVVSYLDDSHPAAADAGGPPAIVQDEITGPGVTRKAGLLAACGSLFPHKQEASSVTLVVETDRHLGSSALEDWLEQSGRRFSAALWEVVDLPIRAPAVIRSGMGRLVVRVSLSASGAVIEDVYAAASRDVGHLLTSAIAGLKSADSEVLLPLFYDDVGMPASVDIDAIEGIGSPFAAWAASGAETTDGFKPGHLALSAFIAPSLVVRDLHMDDAHPFLPLAATATIDLRLLPGQNPNALHRALIYYFRERIPDVALEPLLVRQPAYGRLLAAGSLPEQPSLPIAPGDSPAGILEASGIPTVGFATVARGSPLEAERTDVAAIMHGVDLIRTLVDAGLQTSEAPQ